MLDRLQRIVVPLWSVRWLPALGALLAFVVLVWRLLFDTTGSEAMVLPLVALLWCLSCFAAIVTFRQVPPRAEAEDGSWLRFKSQCRRAWYWLLALILIGATLVSLWITLRLTRVWWGYQPG